MAKSIFLISGALLGGYRRLAPAMQRHCQGLINSPAASGPCGRLLVATVNSLLGLLASVESMDNKISTGRAQFVPLCRAGEEMSQMQSSRHTVHVQT